MRASHFGPPHTFAALPPEQSDYGTARAVVVSVPYDGTTTYRSGTRDGPRAIVAASLQLELYDMEFDREIAEVGIHTLPEVEPHLGGPEQMVQRVAEVVAGVLGDGKFPILLGGEHTLTAGAVSACAAPFPDLGILYLDAHADVRAPYLGANYNHASALRLSLERIGCALDGSTPPPAVAAGIRSMAAEEAAYVRRMRLRVVPAHTVAATRGLGPQALDALWTDALESLGPPGRPIYVSVDLDVFDPSLVAAVGTPEPGGLDWYEVTGLIRAAAARHPIVMADVVELAPAEGPVAGAFTAAKLAYKLIGYALYR